jgi:hypothetical protein
MGEAKQRGERSPEGNPPEEYEALCREISKGVSRDEIRQGWERWREYIDSDLHELRLHPIDAMPAPKRDDDLLIFIGAGPLRFLARCPQQFLASLIRQWPLFADSPEVAAALQSAGLNPRARARAFVQRMLIEGQAVADHKIGMLTASAIAWLLSTVEGSPIRLSDFRLAGYDIAYVPRPAAAVGSGKMFNFRVVLSHAPDVEEALATMRSQPLPGWRPKPH